MTDCGETSILLATVLSFYILAAPAPPPRPIAVPAPVLVAGTASWFWGPLPGCYAASTTLPKGTLIVVQGPAGSATVTIRDYGPSPDLHRVIDLAPAVFEVVVGSLARGLGQVTIRRASPPESCAA